MQNLSKKINSSGNLWPTGGIASKNRHNSF